MKKIICGIIAITVVVLCLAAENSVTIVNNTGYTILFMYVSHSSSGKWEEDVLEDDILENGKTLRVSLPRGGKWDIKLIDEDGDTYTKYGVNANSRAVFTIADMD